MLVFYWLSFLSNPLVKKQICHSPSILIPIPVHFRTFILNHYCKLLRPQLSFHFREKRQRQSTHNEKHQGKNLKHSSVLEIPSLQGPKCTLWPLVPFNAVSSKRNDFVIKTEYTTLHTLLENKARCKKVDRYIKKVSLLKYSPCIL